MALKTEYGTIEAVGLDFDGTLADTFLSHHAARRQAFSRVAELVGDEALATIPDEIMLDARHFGANTESIIAGILVKAGITDPDGLLAARLVRLKRKLYAEMAAEGLPQVSGSVEFARKLADIIPGKVAIVTNASYRFEVEPFLRANALDDIFTADNVIATEQKLPPKPHSATYRELLGRMSLLDLPRRLLAVEDVPDGISAANNVLATTVAIATTHTEAEWNGIILPDGSSRSNSDARPDHVVSGFDELSERILKAA